MELLLAPVPLFNKDVAVEAYSFLYQNGNDLLQATRATSEFDGAMRSPLIETMNTVGIEAFSMGKPIFVPIKSLLLLTDLEEQCRQPAEKVILLLDDEAKSDQMYLDSMARLKEKGFRFALQKISSLGPYQQLLGLCDYLFINHKYIKRPEYASMIQQVGQYHRHLALVLTHIDTIDTFNEVNKKDFALFEGPFYRTPLTRGENKVSPLQANLINLLNLVRDENFEFSSVAAIIQRDTALSISLMRLVNSPYLGLSQKIKTINHAVTMLGQLEVRKWVTTAVSRMLGKDRPDEITKISLLRAQFADNMAKQFGLERHAQSLFLMGLFSVLDVVLEMPMASALKMVRVSDPIYDALVNHKGEYYPVFQFLISYEMADWPTISRMMILYDIPASEVYQKYVDTLCWYRDLLSDDTVQIESE